MRLSSSTTTTVATLDLLELCGPALSLQPIQDSSRLGAMHPSKARLPHLPKRLAGRNRGQATAVGRRRPAGAGAGERPVPLSCWKRGRRPPLRGAAFYGGEPPSGAAGNRHGAAKVKSAAARAPST